MWHSRFIAPIARRTAGPAAFAGGILLAGAAAAFSPPAGCSGYLTVQYHGCLMENIWTCEADEPGTKWMALFGPGGPIRVQKVNADFVWLESFWQNPTYTEVLVTPMADPQSMTELLATGTDTYDFAEDSTRQGRVRISGFDTLTGKMSVIDGEPLLNTSFDFQKQLADGTIISRQTGGQYVSEKHRLFFFGTWNSDSGEAEQATPPAEFVYPGETGFFANVPIYDCGAVVSRNEWMESTDD